jgi:hypothetical protein
MRKLLSVLTLLVLVGILITPSVLFASGGYAPMSCKALDAEITRVENKLNASRTDDHYIGPEYVSDKSRKLKADLDALKEDRTQGRCT